MYLPRNYPVAEIGIALWSMVPEHVQEGDILEVRQPDLGIGLKEAKQCLWLLVDGMEQFEYGELKEGLYEPFDATGAYDPPGDYTRFDRNRYCVPLARLQTVFPSLDLNRARDDADAYQPFYTLDTDNNLWLTGLTPLAIEGLVFDKVNGVYL
jgi:hypothetical protein